MLKKTSLYSALACAIMSVFLLLSYAVLIYLPHSQEEALVLRHTPSLTTTTWGVFDPLTGVVRYGHETEVVHPIASITKLFTAYAALSSTSTAREVTIDWTDLSTNGRAGKLVYGDTLTLHELLFPLLLESSNDAGSAIVRTLGDSYWNVITTLITERALTHTRITDATGLSAGNTSTVTDLAKLYTYLRAAYPHLIDITQLRMRIGALHGWVNNDPVRELDAFTGGKHGYTTEAGKTFVGTVSLPNGRGEVGIVLLHSTDLKADVQALLSSF